MKSTRLMGCLSLLLLLFGVARARPTADGIFTDVPPGHWAYEAVKKSCESGVLQGYDGKFHGNKTINRYQMALIVARMLERVGRGGDATRNLSEQDLQNLEALTIEFADELALLNVKLSTLEDNFAELKHDVESIKTDGPFGHRRHGPPSSAGIHGLVALRGVVTDANGPQGAVGSGGGGYTPLVRFSGDVVGPAGSETFTSRAFFTIPQLSLTLDRDIDAGIGAHLQVDLNGDISDNQNVAGAAGGSGTAVAASLPGGNGTFQINEAYIDVDEIFYGVGGRMGTFALPVSREHNGKARTLDYTITPSAVSTRLETYRPVGIEFRNADDVIPWDCRLSLFSGLDGPPSGTGGASPNLINGILFPGLVYATMEPGVAPRGAFANYPYTDVPWGLQTNTTGPNAAGLAVSGIGVFARIGDQPEEGFGWDINYLANGGNISPSTTKRTTASSFQWVVGTLDYYWKYFDIIVQAYGGTTQNTSTTGQVPNTNGSAVQSTGVYGLFNYRFDPDDNLTLRFESGTDAVENLGTVTVTTITVAFNRIMSDHSLFQLEFLSPVAKYTTTSSTPATSAPANDTDQKDTMIQANYKLNF